jgi:predicted RNA-binding Zn ribbon-like protein
VSTSPDTAPIRGELELLERFLNTHEQEDGPEQFTTPRKLERWMRRHGMRPEESLDAEDLAEALRFREAVRGLLFANNGARLAEADVEVLREAAADGELRIEIGADGSAEAVPSCETVGALYARLLAIIERAQSAGLWERLKACPADDCHWAFFDESKNRSRTWCSMEVCGNRAKTRAYRAKQRRRKPSMAGTQGGRRRERT